MEWRLPWENMSSNHIIHAMVVGRTLEVAGQDQWTSLPGPAPQHANTLSAIASLAKQCLSVVPSDRPSFEDIALTLLQLKEQEPRGEPEATSMQAQNPLSSSSRDPLHRLPVCCVCLVNNADRIMSGCGHLCLCDCAQSLSICPLCRAPGLPQRIYLA